MTEKRMAEIAELILQLTDMAWELAKEMGHGFKIETSIAPEICPYPPGTAAASATISPGYEYAHLYDGREILRWKQTDIIPAQIRPGQKPAPVNEALRTLETRK